MTTYFDSSALVAIYVPERFSKAARRTLRKAPQIPFTQLHQLEVLNAFELMVGRGSITRKECREVQTQLQNDLENNRLVRFSVDLDAVFASACNMAASQTAKLLTRSLDLLHIAAAHLAACTALVSGDDSQLAVAKSTGLRTIDIKA